MTKKEGIALAKKYAHKNMGTLWFVIDEPKSGIVVMDEEAYHCKKELHRGYGRCVATVLWYKETGCDLIEYQKW